MLYIHIDGSENLVILKQCTWHDGQVFALGFAFIPQSGQLYFYNSSILPAIVAPQPSSVAPVHNHIAKGNASVSW